MSVPYSSNKLNKLRSVSTKPAAAQGSPPLDGSTRSFSDGLRGLHSDEALLARIGLSIGNCSVSTADPACTANRRPWPGRRLARFEVEQRSKMTVLLTVLQSNEEFLLNKINIMVLGFASWRHSEARTSAQGVRAFLFPAFADAAASQAAPGSARHPPAPGPRLLHADDRVAGRHRLQGAPHRRRRARRCGLRRSCFDGAGAADSMGFSVAPLPQPAPWHAIRITIGRPRPGEDDGPARAPTVDDGAHDP